MVCESVIFCIIARINFIVKLYVAGKKLDNIKVFNDFHIPYCVVYDLQHTLDEITYMSVSGATCMRP